ncbi:hypothetical protein DJ030_02710 [bacterium endosymbiont of Escarpia laminata]|nr:MAG: hypothetical protein DJ030_02710 [bacterium endosymbiont of Escarpia laminata]
MIELLSNQLTFRFPEVHQKAVCHIDFQRTLRIPDDNREYPLPPGLGQFPVEHVDDFAERLPELWRQHGGVFIPMYQSEALWINFSGDYPCAVKIAAGKINAVSGESWSDGLSDDPQDYAVIPEQPWLDGFNVSEGYIRQFVAMPLGEGYTAEEQITGKAEHGGLQIIVYPMKHDAYVEYFEQTVKEDYYEMPMLSRSACDSAAPDMGLAPGGLMRQKIYEDEYGIDAWDLDNSYRCFIHLANSKQYQAITGHQPPHKPASAKAYTNAGLPWFDYYDDSKALSGSDALSELTSVAAKGIEEGKGALPDNDPVYPKVIKIVNKDNVVRDGEF